MEKEKTSKKNNSSVVIMLLAILMIAAGVGLIVTGNNKSLWDDKEKDNKGEQQEQPDDEDDIPDRARVQYGISEEEIEELLIETKANDFPEETWEVSNIMIIGHDENNEKLLISYGEIGDDLTIVYKQTIVSLLNGEASVELPGWNEGERDLTVYNFIMDNDEEEDEEDIELDEDEEGDFDYEESNVVDSSPEANFEEPELEDYELSGPSLDE